MQVNDLFCLTEDRRKLMKINCLFCSEEAAQRRCIVRDTSNPPILSGLERYHFCFYIVTGQVGSITGSTQNVSKRDGLTFWNTVFSRRRRDLDLGFRGWQVPGSHCVHEIAGLMGAVAKWFIPGMTAAA